MSKRKTKSKLLKFSHHLITDLYMDTLVYGEAAIEVINDKGKLKVRRVQLYGGCECGETTKTKK